MFSAGFILKNKIKLTALRREMDSRPGFLWMINSDGVETFLLRLETLPVGQDRGIET